MTTLTQTTRLRLLQGSDLLLLGVALIWGTSYGVAKQALVFYPVLGFLAVRFCLTFLILLPQLRGAGRRAWAPGLPLGGVLLAIFLAETYGVQLTTASNAAFLISLCVVLTPFVEWLLLGQRPERRVLPAVALSLLGTWLLSGGVNLAFNLGDGLMLLAALLRALLVCLTRRLTAASEVPALALTAVQTGVVGGGCLLLGFTLLPGGLPPLPQAPAFWIGSLYLVLFATLLAFYVQNHALRRSSPTRVALLMGSEPLFGALFAVLWLSEQLSAQAWLGGLLIVAATLWTGLLRRQ
ncbi:EamA family transporter [Pseudomonas sp. UL073]|uniref:EamA family transporter n=1 Tax=Zestomonas insulae TaxID=2809017 RepID=A0ABS2IH74_9GAMM|nr:EamA family transporter [Pseudomonas insulae]MBM7062419.1 EamA family transporter [Pseudomonas insulae]